MTLNEISLTDWLALLAEPALVITASGEVVARNAAFGQITEAGASGDSFGDLLAVGEADILDQVKIWARNKQPVAGALSLKTAGGDYRVTVQAGRLSGVMSDGEAPLVLLRFKPQQEITEAFRTLTEQVAALRREVSIRKRTEEELLALKESLQERVEERTAQLNQAARRLIEAEEAERRRLAHVLHDNLQQLLVTAAFHIERIRSIVADPDVMHVTEKLGEVIQESISVSRSLTLDLTPPVLHERGLCAALDWLARRHREQHQIEVVVRVDSSAEPAEEQVRIALFTCARELLFNVVKHARVGSASVEFGPAGDGRVVLRVSDNGPGFDLAAVEEQKRGEGFGLFSLRERAEILGGRLRIHTGPGLGTTVEIELPTGA